MSTIGEDVDEEQGVPSPNTPSPRSFGHPSLQDDDNDNLTCQTSQEFEDTRQVHASILS